jgi:nitrite reductase (NADH) small subunit
MSDKDWTEVGHIDDIPLAGARVVNTAQGRIALFRTGDDKVWALHDKCPHKGGPLSQGMVYGHKVACPMHNLSIDLETGEAVAPDTGCAATYPVKIEGGAVYVALGAAVCCLDS